MNIRKSLSGLLPHLPKTWLFRVAMLTGLVAITAGIVISAPSTSSLLPPSIDLPAEPLYMNGSKAKGNLTLALSVEEPTVGQTYRDTFTATKRYVGYFDPMICYRQVPASSGSSNGSYFDVSNSGGKPTLASKCASSQFDGNFMNWATSSAIDIFRYGLTGGHRTRDDDQTVIERAWLPDNFYRNASFFSEKYVPLLDFEGRTELSQRDFPAGVWIYNCKNRIYFATAKDDPLVYPSSTCSSPFSITAEDTTSHPFLKGNTKTPYYEVRSLACDPSSAPNRLMTYDPVTKQWSGLCFRYPSGKYKPVGQLQMNADSLRVSVFSYLNGNTADSNDRYGGVMRSPLKYVGPNSFDQSFNLVSGTNPRSEWNATTGVFTADPQNGDVTYGNQGYPYSGAINYINRFGTLGMTPTLTIADPVRSKFESRYKINDPLSELYYEVLRYLQGKTTPTSQAIANLTGTVSSDKVLTENFPAYRTWTDPFTGFVDNSGVGNGCMRNSIATISDVFTTYDRSVPGFTAATTTIGDFSRAVETSPDLDVPFWSSVVGGFESGNAVSYVDGQGRSQSTSNLAGNTTYSWLSDAGTRITGAGTNTTTLATPGNAGGSYHVAGMAYWANTHAFRNDFTKARVKTFAIDVNQGDSSAQSADFKRTRQIYLSAKYGGFEDSQANNSGNPYQPGTNLLWQGTDGDAKNYFLASDAQKFLDSLSELFAKVVEETGSIAGGAISTQRLTVGQAAAVFQARFNPVANFWSGRLLKYPLSLDTTGTSLVIGTTATWEAGQVLTTEVAGTRWGDNAVRKIVIGSPTGQQATQAPTLFQWSNLAASHKTAFNTTPYTTTLVIDTLGQDRLNYIRGDRSKELTAANPTGIFRPRDIVLGDVINSGLVYMGKPSNVIGGGAAFNTFYNANSSRRPVIFANANDGMLHAFYNSDGKEAFAYVPGFIAHKLNVLPDQDYSHISINDATPAVADVFIGSEWKSVLVSGVGGGGQGLFALDVTNPADFGPSKVLWEFTKRDSSELGNIIGTPKILKFRTTAFNVRPAVYKTFAVVASGVNNYVANGTNTVSVTGNPSIFIIDISRKPNDYPAEAPWTEGTNFWRIALPQNSLAIAKGLVGFTAVENPLTGAVDSIYAGDLQGNVWKLDFTLKGTGQLASDALTNTRGFNFTAGNTATFFIAKDSANALQPITGEPVISNAFYGSNLISFGTGKYLEVSDTTVPGSATASFYTLLDKNSSAVSGRSMLQQGSVSSGGTVTVPSFVYGTPPLTGTSTLKLGWYFDFDRSIGERQVSDITGQFNQLFFGSLFPTQGSCGEGGGRFYSVNVLTGNGISELSKVGILAAPLVLEVGDTALTVSDTSGQRTAGRRVAIITQGSKGLGVAANTNGGLTYTQQVGRLSWRQLNNYRENKNN